MATVFDILFTILFVSRRIAIAKRSGSLVDFQVGRRPWLCMGCPARERDGGSPRYTNALDMVLPRVSCEILQVCPLLLLLLLRGW